MKISDVIKDASCWTQGTYARDEKGNDIPATVITACVFCLTGALRRIRNGMTDTEYYGICANLENVIRAQFPKRLDLCAAVIVSFNDHPDTTYEDVKKVIELAGV